MKQIKLLFLKVILGIALIAIPLKTRAFENQNMADSVVKNLTAVTSADTIRQLYDALDVSNWKQQRGEIGWQILNVAHRSKDYTAMTDQLLQLANIYKSDSISMARLFEIWKDLPDDDNKKGVRLFMRVEQITGDATFLSVEERNNKLMSYLKEEISTKDDIYENVYDLYSTVIFLGKETKGNLYHEYMDRLEKMIQQLPEDYYLKNLFYTTAAIFYTQNNYPEKAVECDRQLLKQIEKLEELYMSQGRKYRNYDRFYYICYRRMLRNYAALSNEEVKDLYARCERLAEKDEEVARDFNMDGRIKAYRLLADKNFAAAIPYLKQSLRNNKDVTVHRELLGFLVEAADSVGDKPTLLSALKEYNKMLLDDQKIKSEEALREMQIRYDVHALQSEKNELEIEKRDLELATDQKLINIVLASLCVMAIVLMLLCRGYFRLKSDNRELKEENDKLKTSLENYFRDGVPEGTRDVRDAYGSVNTK
ncbi:MAG: hypothetical protein HDR88_01035 [Bacteroides sp.]|nr:hypothetical protein [Bacteroides sp.]